MENVQLQVSEFVALLNQTLEYAYPSVVIIGEVSNFRVSKNRWVYFDLKDESSSVKFFGTVYQLPGPIEDGMILQVKGTPRLHQLYGFSVTVQAMAPVGEGSLKRAFELLKAKLENEGLFAPERKRSLPRIPSRVGVISSTEAAGYADFIKILNDRWGGIEVAVANTQVQGIDAPRQIVGAIDYFNKQAELVDVLVIIRGGGSADDLSAFNDEVLVRSIASSRIPTLVGVGHEVDVSLADMAADVRAATPSNAAQILVPDKGEILRQVEQSRVRMLRGMERSVANATDYVANSLELMSDRTLRLLQQKQQRLGQLKTVIAQLNPNLVLRRGYALVRDEGGKVLRGEPKMGSRIKIQTKDYIITAGVENVEEV